MGTVEIACMRYDWPVDIAIGNGIRIIGRSFPYNMTISSVRDSTALVQQYAGTKRCGGWGHIREFQQTRFQRPARRGAAREIGSRHPGPGILPYSRRRIANARYRHVIRKRSADYPYPVLDRDIDWPMISQTCNLYGTDTVISLYRPLK